MSTIKVSKYQHGNGISLSKIDGQAFTIVSVRDQPYDDGNESTPGVAITTKEEFKVDDQTNKVWLTTRKAIVSTLSDPDLREQLRAGNSMHVKCVQAKSKRGFSYWVLEDC